METTIVLYGGVDPCSWDHAHAPHTWALPGGSSICPGHGLGWLLTDVAHTYAPPVRLRGDNDHAWRTYRLVGRSGDWADREPLNA